MSLPDEHERIRFTTTIIRAESYVVRLKVDQATDVDALARYWSPTGWTEDIRPLRRLGCDLVLCGGDLVDLAEFPDEVIDRLSVDACPVGTSHRFSHDRITYHYTKNEKLLATCSRRPRRTFT